MSFKKVEDFIKSEKNEYWDKNLLKDLAAKTGYSNIRFFKALIRCMASQEMIKKQEAGDYHENL